MTVAAGAKSNNKPSQMYLQLPVSPVDARAEALRPQGGALKRLNYDSGSSAHKRASVVGHIPRAPLGALEDPTAERWAWP